MTRVLRLLIGLHHLELGGSQLNALDLATVMRDRGHHVMLFATHTGQVGPVAALAQRRGLPLTFAEHPLERTRRGAVCRPSVAAAMTRLVRDERVDLVHAYEYPLILDAFFGPSLRFGTRLVGTVYGMIVPTWLPRGIALIAGTRNLVDSARRVGHRATLIEPPVNTLADSPEAVDGSAFRAQWGLKDRDIALVVVSRLEPDMKREGISRAIAAQGVIDDPRVRLIVVGGGPSFEDLSTEAARLNATLGREAVAMIGPLSDPRPAYAGADIVLGMGSSALRAMSFARPLIVLGIGGFSRPFTPEHSGYFFEAGFYGIGDGIQTPDPLVDQIRTLTANSAPRESLGAWSRKVVVDRYSLDAAASALEALYEDVLARPDRSRVGPAVQTAVHRTAADLAGPWLREKMSPMVRRVLGR